MNALITWITRLFLAADDWLIDRNLRKRKQGQGRSRSPEHVAKATIVAMLTLYAAVVSILLSAAYLLFG
jgi:hypothetical protein